MNNRQIVFAHIPKTAGTSFRTAIEESGKEESLVKDYGVTSQENSTEVKRFYENNDIERLKLELNKKPELFISSHFQDTRLKLSGYCKILPSASLATFFRDPVDRIISEYWHFKDIIGYQGGFSEFISQNSFINRQSASIDWIPLERFHFVGTTENYAESLSVFNEIFKTKALHKISNEKKSKTPKLEGISQNDIERFCKTNIEDIALYNKAVEHSTRIIRKDFKIKPMHRFAGAMRVTDEGSISGWGIDYSSTYPARIIFETHQGSYSTISSIKREDLKELNIHSSGYAGFNVPIEEVRRHVGTGEITVSIEHGIKIGSTTK